MKITIYKSSIFSLLITNIWSVTIFFMYYFEHGLFSGFKTLTFFLFSCWITSGVGGLAILISFLKIWKSNQQKVFLLSTMGILNFFFLLLLVLSNILEVLNLRDALVELYLIFNFIIPIAIFFTLKKKLKAHQSQT
ncbi:hypothetical protein [Flavobacterium sp.]|uniref:hypothetical protein n=1 Tax=Flavobacterium sp. TaxID=239 RepID=UPI002ED92882